MRRCTAVLLASLTLALAGCAWIESLQGPADTPAAAPAEAQADSAGEAADQQSASQPAEQGGTPLACTETEGGDAALMSYGRAAMAGVKSNWRAPRGPAYAGLSTAVRLSVDKAGFIRKYEIVKPSGRKDFDDSVVTSLRRTRRLPPPPEAVGECIVMNFRATQSGR